MMIAKRLLIVAAGVVATLTVAWAQAPEEGPREKPGSGAVRQKIRERMDRLREDGPAASKPALTPLTDAEQAELLGWIKQRRPEHLHRLEELRQDRPQQYQMALRMLWRWYQSYKQLPEPLREDFLVEQELRMKTWRLAQAIRQAPDEQARAKLIEELRGALNRQFEAELKVQRWRLKEMEERLAKVRQDLQQRQENRQAEIDKRLDGLLKASTQPGGRPPEGGPLHGHKDGGPKLPGGPLRERDREGPLPPRDDEP